MTKVCHYCSTKEHSETQGIVSVDPKYENRWFCSTTCLCDHKTGGLRMRKSKKK